MEETCLQMFHTEDHQNLKLAFENPNQLKPELLKDLVKVIMEKVVEDIKNFKEGAKLCIAIAEKEKNLTFIQSLLNLCQKWYQQREQLLCGKKAGGGTKFSSFMWFLTEMYGQLKRHQFKEKFKFLEPEITLLSILAKCCQTCLETPMKCLPETECSFFVLTSIGRDLEAELPQQIEQLMESARDAFLSTTSSPEVKKTLLQIIELQASNWNLRGSSVFYYDSRIK